VNTDKQAGLVYVSPAFFSQIFSQNTGTPRPLWLRPVGIDRCDVLACALRDDDWHMLAGGGTGFTHLDMVTCHQAGYIAVRVSVGSAAALGGDAAVEQLAQLSAPRPAFAGLDMGRAHVMGIVNMTPDSFSDGGRLAGAPAACAVAAQMMADGASLVDVGGESTRPGAAPVSREEELDRILPVITALAAQGITVSADTRHTEVMGPAVAAGASIINDVSGFTATGAAALMGDIYKNRPDKVFAIAMHMQGEPQTMQDNPAYRFAPVEVFEGLKAHIDRLVAAGLPRSHIAIDPGFGFGKTPAHNAQLIQWTALFHGLGVPLLIGVSRKSSIPKLAAMGQGGAVSGYGGDAASERLGGGLALCLAATQQGAQIIRTHDVPETSQALAVQRGVG